LNRIAFVSHKIVSFLHFTDKQQRSMLSFDQVSISKNDHIVLSDINWHVSEGENWAILGESGSGKSTLLDAIAGKVFPLKGKITREPGKKIELVPRDYSFHKIVGAAYQYYQQRYNSHDAEIGPTVLEILQGRIKPIGTINEKSVELAPPVYTEEWVKEVSRNLKIDHLLERKITSLSNGETRRTLITISLLKKPDILVLDNPFTGLDKESRKLLKEIIDELGRSGVRIIIALNFQDLPESITHLLELQGGSIKKIHKRPFDGLEKETNSSGIKLPGTLNFTRGYSSENFDIAIRFNKATVTYNGKNVVDGVDWEVKRGERWALMGPNGSGKSTILSLVTGDNPQCYQNDFILFDRKRGTGESIWDIKKRTGFISPELHLYFNRNIEVWKVVGSGFFDSAGLFRKLTNEQKELKDQYLQLLNLKKYEERKLTHLSSGQQRLVFLARALVKNPSLLLLDEPCQGLDYNQMVYFRELLNYLVVELNKTLVYVTHYEDEIPDCVTKRLNLSEGRAI
jgi:molybdate transport system ATP-binding protein